MQERYESDQRVNTLCNLPANTFAAIYAECDPVWAGARYNGVYYSELEIYAASLMRDEGYEDFL
ncbi:hypothetical protein FD644_10845 [Serratia fonticola]|nr:hypothetical protein FD644_10845 [Serratia fonticola]